jgi:phosphomevalonate decarboxylase
LKATAVAFPIQGLIKYHGLRDRRLRLPFHDSISVCTGPIHTRTTVEFGYREDSAEIDGVFAKEEEMRRIMEVVTPLRKMAGEESGVRMVSKNDFPSNIGLGASASGFAALAVATAASLGLKMGRERLSGFARRGAGSASRSVTGGFSRWYAGTDDESSVSRRIISPAEKEMGMVVALVPAKKFTDTAHEEVLTSPFFKARLEYVGGALEEMEAAIRNGEVDRIGELAERDTLLLHGITMTGADKIILWRPETLSIILEVRSMQEEGVECHFSIDTGATVYVNCHVGDVNEIESRISDLGVRTMICRVGGEANTVDDHLF